MRWTNEMRSIIRSNYPQKTYKEIAELLNTSTRSVERQLTTMHIIGEKKILKCKNKQSPSIIGSRRRASNKYNGILSRIRSTNRSKNKHYANIAIKVSRVDFINWYMPLDFKGASIDRIDKNGDYELNNMQVIPLPDNIRKDKIKTLNGMCECFKCHTTKPIKQFAKDKRRSTGYSTICLDCERERGRLKYRAAKESTGK